MNKDAVMIVRGFLQLPNLEKKKVVDALNQYFDEINEREEFRSEIESRFNELGVAANSLECKCCGRT